MYEKWTHKNSKAILILLTSSANYLYNMIIHTGKKMTEKILSWTEKYFFESGYNQRTLKPFRYR